MTVRPPGGAALGTAGPSGPAPVAERRLVSVLFADLVGFTPFAEERDAEEVRETLTRYFAIASQVIELYGGVVEKFIGDAVMAVWGTPTAREDDAERAVRAGLDLVEAVRGLRSGIQARAGVMSGEAAVTVGATNEGMVAGDLVNTAARIQAAALPGCVLTGEATMRAASASIAFEAAGDQALKGKASVVPTWRALRVVAQRGGQGRSDMPEPPFVGREEELRLLKDLIATSGRDRRARLVSITGPGGIGKSRLAWELEKYIDGIAGDVYWHRGRSPSYGEGITFWALGEMVRRRAGLAEDDDNATTRDRIHASVEEYIPDDADRRWVEPALLTLLGLEPAPAGGRDVLFAAWRIFFERIAERGTTILLFEDLQWADSGLLDFIEYLLEWSRAVPLIVVCLARPELLDRRTDWGANTRNLTRLALEPLNDDAMRALLAGFVPGLPAAAVEAILVRADGMPLYAVETVRALVAEGRLEMVDGTYRPVGELGTLTVPDSLRSLIASRLDSLEPFDRSLVADAAGLGQAFTAAALAAVGGQDATTLEPHLRLLVRRELFDVEADPRSPERGQYHFVQSLIREVAYGTLARRDRRARHLAAARYFEGLGEEELAGALASHYVAAHAASDSGPEADAVAIQARLALSGAADRAVTLGAHDQAVTYLRSAAAITTDDSERGVLLLRAAQSANAAAHHADAEILAREAVHLAQAGGDASSIGSARSLLGEVLIDFGDPPAAVAVLELAVNEFPDGGAAEVRATLLSNLSRAYMRTAQQARAIAAADLALDLAEHLGLERLVAETFNNKGSALSYLGRRRESMALLQAAVDVARAGGFVAAEIRALSNMASAGDDPRASSGSAQAAQRLALRVGNRSLANWAAKTGRWCAWLLAEDWDAAIADSQSHTGETAERAWSPLDEVWHLAITGLFLAGRGESTDATLARLEALSAEVSDSFAASAVHGLRSDRAFLMGDYRAAIDEALLAAREDNFTTTYLGSAMHATAWSGDLERALVIADLLDADPASDRGVKADRIAARAAIAALEGRVEDAVAGYRDAMTAMRSIGADYWTALTALDFVRRGGGDHPATRGAAAEARVIFERVGARPFLAKLDEALATRRAPIDPPPIDQMTASADVERVMTPDLRRRG
ncbi:MAG: AAA family ATPase [Chloroflexi bacterium]|nr:AAA family ATPase [Chloroflexota bacterium]